MELIDRSQFAEAIIEIGMREINKVLDKQDRYKIDFNLEVLNDKTESPYMEVKKIERLRLPKTIRRKLFKTKLNFIVNISDVDEYNKLSLIDYYMDEYDLNLFDLIEHNLGVEDAFFVLATLHEVGHIEKLLKDFKSNGYFKEDMQDKMEFETFMFTSMIFDIPQHQKFNGYRGLRRERYADDFSVRVFKKYLEDIKRIFN